MLPQGWAIDPNEIELCVRPDGSLHALGCGAYAKVLVRGRTLATDAAPALASCSHVL